MEFSLTENWWQFLVIAVICYLVGGLNAARFFSRSKHQDITKMGSGNPGTMNTTRVYGWKAGCVVFLGDALKAAIPVLLAYLHYRDYIFAGTNVVVSDVTRYYCAVFVVIGHICPIYQKFKGGKGIASTLGAFWVALSCESLWYILVGFGVAVAYVGFVFWTEWGSLASLCAVSGCTIAQAVIYILRYGMEPFNAYLVCVYASLFALVVLTWCAHNKNLIRLFAGEEHRTSFRKFFKRKK